MNNIPLVSIIVRTKDRPELLKKALKSIADQTYRPIEVILVNDGGCDLDVQEVKKILVSISVNYIILEKNAGRAHAGNRGIQNAKGEYIGFLDDDDEFYPDHVSTLIGFLKQSEYKIAYTISDSIKVSFDKDGNEVIEEKKQSLKTVNGFSKEILLIGNYIPFNTLIIKRSILYEIGEIDENLELYEDWDFLIRISEKYPFYFINKITSKYKLWSRDKQITAMTGLSKEPYLKVVNKHLHKIVPEVLYNAYLSSHEREELKMQLNTQQEFIKDLQNNNKDLQNNNKDLQNNNKDLQNNIKEMQAEKNSLLESVENLNVTLHEINETLGWKFLIRFRSLRNKILPPGTKRNKIYSLFIKSLKVFASEGFSGVFVKVKRKLRREYFLGRLNRHKWHYNSSLCGLDNCFQKKPIDIILPVFNGVGTVKACVESISEYTDLTFNNLIIIDDNSTDTRIKEMLQGLVENRGKISIIFNDQNIGFVKTVNKGMKMSDTKDVIILNSDTIVTRNWVDKLQRAAYSSPNVATVTPFSNNATICSIPDFLENNTIPANFDIHSFGEFIEDISLTYYPEIPTAVGFCMYIKRTVLQEVGFFDEINFGKGYGEENDFCMRAIKMGYKNILDDSTFIYHKGGESFSASKKVELEQKGVAKVDGIHPEFLPMVHKFINENPLKPVHEYIKIRLNLICSDSVE